MKTINRSMIGAVLFLTGTVCAFALEINGTAPTFSLSDKGDVPSIPGISIDIDPGDYIEQTLNDIVREAFDTALAGINKEIGNIDAKPEQFIQSWGNASVFASHGATQRAYGGYKNFSITLGPMVGLQLPDSPFNIVDELKDLPQNLNDGQDTRLGVNPQVINARFGINTSKFLLDKLYLGLHVGFIKLNGGDFDLDGFTFETFSIGGTVNYQLVPQKTFANGMLLWRGVNIGSGLIYSGTKIGGAMNLGKQDVALGDMSNNSSNNDINVTGTLAIDPKLVLDMKIDTFTVPLEVVTAVKLFWFLNIPIGVGVDFGFGKSDIKLGVTGNLTTNDMKIDVLGEDIKTKGETPGNVSVMAGGDVPPSVANLKLMTGVGFNIGPVIIDVPVTFYLGNGYSVGVTLGAVW